MTFDGVCLNISSLNISGPDIREEDSLGTTAIKFQIQLQTRLHRRCIGMS